MFFAVAAGRGAEHVHHMPRLAHVPGHDEEQRGQRRHRQVPQGWRQRQDRQQDEEGVEDGGQRRPRTRADIGRRAGEGSGGRDAAEEGSDEIACPLGHQLGVRVVRAAGHAIGDHGREQRFDRSQHGDGESRRRQVAQQLGLVVPVAPNRELRVSAAQVDREDTSVLHASCVIGARG